MTTEYQYNLGLKFQSIVEQFPDKVALKFPEGKTFTYTELNRLADVLGCYLLEQGYKQGDVVVLFNEKTEYGYAMILACLKTGIIYTNLDVTSPWLRIQKIISSCQPKAVFYDAQPSHIFTEINEAFPGTDIRFIEEIDLKAVNTQQAERGVVNQNFHGHNPAYIMFTSGSTGFPKGALMSHQNLLNFIQWGRQTFQVSPEDIFTNANPIYFDNSVFDFYVSIFNGATLIPLSHELVKNPKALVQAINNSGCTIWFSVPSLLVYLLTTKALTKDDFKTITRISFGGEGFPKNKLKQLFSLFGERIKLFNVYGPTECTCICSSYIITEDDFVNMNELAPLGLMAPNFGYAIEPADESNTEYGELCLIGPCVGLGYYNDPERTVKSFVQNPNVAFPQVMYKTGDLVERAPNGYLHFRGRSDNQVKHMGYRIELEEIEAAFSTLDYVDEVGVIYERINAELGQIKAYISVNTDMADTQVILEDIKAIVPPYMVPRIIRTLPVLPKNQNGKIDRKQLKELP